MNGRVYDPVIGRFVSADPIIQAPENTQSYNRYSYVMNNPLSYTDPSGYSRLSRALKKAGRWIGDNWRTIAAVAITVVSCIYAGCAAAGAWSVSGAAVVAAGGFAAGMVASGGDLRAGLVGAITAVAFFGAGQALGSVSWANSGEMVGKIVVHGSIGGFSSVAQGGKFKSGFLSAGSSAALAPIIHDNIGGGAPGQVVAASIVGGTASALGGGKFANGAVTAAFSYAFNELMPKDGDVTTYENEPKMQLIKGNPYTEAEMLHVALSDDLGIPSALLSAGGRIGEALALATDRLWFSDYEVTYTVTPRYEVTTQGYVLATAGATPRVIGYYEREISRVPLPPTRVITGSNHVGWSGAARLSGRTVSSSCVRVGAPAC